MKDNGNDEKQQTIKSTFMGNDCKIEDSQNYERQRAETLMEKDRYIKKVWPKSKRQIKHIPCRSRSRYLSVGGCVQSVLSRTKERTIKEWLQNDQGKKKQKHQGYMTDNSMINEITI